MTNPLRWLIQTEAGLWTRLTIGLCIFLILAATDLKRNGPTATRWREYLFLLSAVAAAMAYGVLNDSVTSSISWEYFYYGKDLARVLGPTTPPDPAALHWQAAKIGMMATWWVGLITGAALLIANNPYRNLPRLAYLRLLRQLPPILLTCATFGLILGILGYQGYLTHLSSEFEDLVRSDLFRPRRFLCAWGVHLGAYIGGVLGTVIATVNIMRARRRLAATTTH